MNNSLNKALNTATIEKLDEINVALAVVAHSVRALSMQLDGCSELLPDERLEAAHTCIIEAIHEVGLRIGVCKADAAIDAARQQE